MQIRGGCHLFASPPQGAGLLLLLPVAERSSSPLTRRCSQMQTIWTSTAHGLIDGEQSLENLATIVERILACLRRAEQIRSACGLEEFRRSCRSMFTVYKDKETRLKPNQLCKAGREYAACPRMALCVDFAATQITTRAAPSPRHAGRCRGQDKTPAVHRQSPWAAVGLANLPEYLLGRHRVRGSRTRCASLCAPRAHGRHGRDEPHFG